MELPSRNRKIKGTKRQVRETDRKNAVEMEEKKMSFGENLQFLRKQKEITQEQLAEQLEVSRQSVSKWESGTSYPEMDKLLQICSMFQCNMDTLMQGDVSNNFAEDVCGYDRFQNRFARLITAGVGLILFGLSVMMLLTGMGVDDALSSAVFFVFVIVAVMIFVVMGMQNERFRQRNPVIQDFYTEEEKERAYQKFTVRIAVGVGTILIGLLFVIIGDEMAEEVKEEFISGIFMLMVTAGASVLAYAGMQKTKYDIKNYNKEANPSPERKKRDELKGKICGCIMLIATIIFLIWSFSTGAWRITWIVYPVAGICCGIVAVALSKDDEAD